MEIAVSRPDTFSTLVTALQTANLVETLSGAGPFTVFAPTNAAFAALPAGDLAALLADIPQLTSILTYHVVPGTWTTDTWGASFPDGTLTNGQVLTTLNGDTLTVRLPRGADPFGDAQIVTQLGLAVSFTRNGVASNLIASNGVVQSISRVLIPANATVSSTVAADTTTAAPASATPPTFPQPTPNQNQDSLAPTVAPASTQPTRGSSGISR